VKSIVENAHQLALSILHEHRELLETIATQLLETEVIEGETLNQFLSRIQPVEVKMHVTPAG
jgi:cell division protease FtsH